MSYPAFLAMCRLRVLYAEQGDWCVGTHGVPVFRPLVYSQKESHPSLRPVEVLSAMKGRI